MLEFVDEVDHVFTEGGAMDAVGVVSIFVACILCLQGKTHKGHVGLCWHTGDTVTKRDSGQKHYSGIFK